MGVCHSAESQAAAQELPRVVFILCQNETCIFLVFITTV